MVVVSDLNKIFGGSTDLAKKWHGSADLHTPIHPPSLNYYRNNAPKTVGHGESILRLENHSLIVFLFTFTSSVM